MSGTLYIVATPIGNLGDLSPRAGEVLARVPVIAAEDTRVSRRLVPSRPRPPRWVSLNEHNEKAGVPSLIARLEAGDDVALVSDAGTPMVSDPGYRLVDAAHAAGIRVSPVPGPSAAIAALSAAGLPSDRFRFEGFLPARAAARRSRLEVLSAETATLIFFVPARDLPATLADMATAFGGDRPGAVARELTKQFETVRRDGLATLAAFVDGDPDQLRGEAVVLVGGAQDAARPALDLQALARALGEELPPARAAKVLTRVGGLDRKAAFALVESLRSPGSGPESGS